MNKASRLQELRAVAIELLDEIESLDSDLESAKWDGLSPCDIRNLEAEKEEKEVEHGEVEEEIADILEG